MDERSRQRSCNLWVSMTAIILLMVGAAACTPPAADLAAVDETPSTSTSDRATPKGPAGATSAAPSGPPAAAPTVGPVASFVDNKTGLAITAVEGGTVTGQPANSTAAQAWRLTPIGNQTVTVQSVSTSQCLTAPTASGGQVQTSACTSSPTQLFGVIRRAGTLGWDLLVPQYGFVLSGPTTEAGPVTASQDPGNPFITFPPYGMS